MSTLALLLLLLQPVTGAPPAPAQELPAAGLRGYVKAGDYPPEALRRGEQGNVRFLVVVGVDGKPKSCSIVASSGSTALDNRTCKIMQERLRFEPARDAAGQLAEGTYTGTLNWRFSN